MAEERRLILESVGEAIGEMLAEQHKASKNALQDVVRELKIEICELQTTLCELRQVIAQERKIPQLTSSLPLGLSMQIAPQQQQARVQPSTRSAMCYFSSSPGTGTLRECLFSK